MKPGDVRINLKNLDGVNISEYLVTDGVNHALYSPYRPDGVGISDGLLKAILRDHADMALADLALILSTPCER